MASQEPLPIPPIPERELKRTEAQPEEAKQDEATPSISFLGMGKSLFVRYTSGWFSSVLVHVAILLVLAAFTLPSGATEQLRELLSSSDQDAEELDDMDDEKEVDLDLDQPLTDDLVAVEDTVQAQPESVSDVQDVAGAAVAVDLSELGFEKAPKSDLMATVGAFSGKELGGRGEMARKALVARGGGNHASEAAVEAGLAWLAEHQMPDGGWTFQINLCPRCNGQCRNAGKSYSDARAAATGLALMPFLGAGETHMSGKYKKVVNAGLNYLVSQMDAKGSFSKNSGNMYSHGIASITLCEAFAMTKDKRLYEPAQRSIDYICMAQDPVGGGWRYRFQTPGDTSVVGWQIMALKSANLGYLKVPGITIQKATKYLDYVQSDNGASYGYMEPSRGRGSMTAVGLLCRMYMGWKSSDEGLARGVAAIASGGPKKDVYFNYYATQVLHHWGGELWTGWNRVMRDQLINSQAKEGHERGSWFDEGGAHGQEGAGRLYCTSMNTMILEIYYRYLPIYQKESTATKFSVE